MIDWHSHILPGIDDGSQDVTESSALLKMLSEQCVDTVIATPHFLANSDTVETFLEKRKKSYDALSQQTSEDFPDILLGAEIKYYQGISRMKDLKSLCIEKSKLLLLEMSISKWTEYTVREIEELALSRDITVVLAHIERYLKFQSNETWERLYGNGVLMQVNASFFTNFTTKRKALTYLENGRIHFIGSDCHNLTSRAPRIGKAFEIINNKLGENFTNQMNEYGHSVLKK